MIAVKREEKQQRLQHIQAAHEFYKKEKIKQATRKKDIIEELHEIRSYVRERRYQFHKKASVDDGIWKANNPVTRHYVPGPGTYEMKTTLVAKGGQFSRFKPKTDVEWKILHAKEIPGPGEYAPPSDFKLNKLNKKIKKTNYSPQKIEALISKFAEEENGSRNETRIQ